MEKIKYLIKRIMQMDYKNMFRIAKKISNKTGKNYIWIIIDMIIVGIKYQAGYYDYQEFEFYNLNRNQRKTYLTRGKNNQIIKKFNDKSKFYLIDNKFEFYKGYKEFIKRDWILIDGKNFDEFEKFLETNKTAIVKPVDGEGGKGVAKIECKNLDENKKTYEDLVKNKQNIVEQCIKQHKELNELYESSVNSLRMFTFYKEGTVYFLQAILKIGNGGIVDNFSSGGMYAYVDENGYVYTEAIDRADNIFPEHPISKHKIVGFKVPMFEGAVDLVKEAAKVIPEVRYVGWDVAISEEGPIIIEGNCFPGVFQAKPSLTKDKVGLVPKYNEVMNIF